MDIKGFHKLPWKRIFSEMTLFLREKCCSVDESKVVGIYKHFLGLNN